MNNIGTKLMNLRKEHHLSQEEAAEKLGVTRQTISKWETEESKPDFDKINLICELYRITPNELFGDTEPFEEPKSENNTTAKKAFGISGGIFLYFIAVAWMIISVETLKLDPVIGVSGFIAICGLATFAIVFVSLVYKGTKEDKEEKEKNPLKKAIKECLAIITAIIYFIISFATMAWHVTWIIWLIYGLIEEIVNLLFVLKEIKNEK